MFSQGLCRFLEASAPTVNVGLKFLLHVVLELLPVSLLLLCADPSGADFYKFSLGMHCVWQILGRVGGDRKYLQAESKIT